MAFSRTVAALLALCIPACVSVSPAFDPVDVQTLRALAPPSRASARVLYSTREDWAPASDPEDEEFLLDLLRETQLFATVDKETSPAGAYADYELRFRFLSEGHTTWAWTGIFAFVLPVELGHVDVTGDLQVYDHQGDLLSRSEAEAKLPAYINPFHMIALGPSHTPETQSREAARLLILELMRDPAVGGAFSGCPRGAQSQPAAPTTRP